MSAVEEKSEAAELLHELRELREELRRSVMREPLTEDELAKRWKVSKRHLKRICEKIGLCDMGLGYQTKRFRPADIQRAEERGLVKKSRRARA